MNPTFERTKAGDVIRLLLTLVLVAVAYTETGWATGLCLLLIAARAEVQDFNEGRTWK